MNLQFNLLRGLLLTNGNSMKKILIALFVVLLAGCNHTANKTISHEEYQELLKQTILLIPDSLLTKEQLQLKIKVLDFMNQHTYIENNCQKLSVGKESFEKEGIPAFYYDVIQYQMKETNECAKECIESGDIPAIHLKQDSLFKEYKVRYKEIDRPRMIKLLESK